MDIGELIRNQVPDRKGTTLPPDITHGTYSIRDLKRKARGFLFEGKINVDRTFGHAMYGCAQCCGYWPPYMYPASTTLEVGGLGFQQTVWATNSCWFYDDELGGYNWASSNAGVASVSQQGIVFGLAAGSSTIAADTDYDAPFAYCPPRTARPTATVNVAKLTCTPTTVTRGASVSCTATGGSGSNWKFTAGSDTVNGPSSGASWSGVMVQSGTITVTITPSGGAAINLAANITVNPRAGFAFPAVSPTKQANPYSGNCTISVPTAPAAGNAVGYSCVDQQFSQTPYLIGDNGPNHGFRYVYNASSTYNSVPTTFNFVIAGYLDDSGTEFAQKQCGNYNLSTNTGYISHAQLKSNTYEHESGSITGHYATYKLTQDDSTNNIGTAVEAVVGPPGQSETDFNQQARDVANSKGSAIASAAFPTPETLTTFCNSDVRNDPTCVFRGFINWPVYTSCQ